MYYRVEKDGTGPYRGPEVGILDGRNCRQHPNSCDDYICGSWYDSSDAAENDGWTYVFAFSSMQQLYNWFRGEIHILIRWGYKIVEYKETKHLDWPVFHGNRQVIFAVPNGAPMKPQQGQQGQEGPEWADVLDAFGPDEWNPDEMPYDYEAAAVMEGLGQPN